MKLSSFSMLSIPCLLILTTNISAAHASNSTGINFENIDLSNVECVKSIQPEKCVTSERSDWVFGESHACYANCQQWMSLKNIDGTMNYSVFIASSDESDAFPRCHKAVDAAKAKLELQRSRVNLVPVCATTDQQK